MGEEREEEREERDKHGQTKEQWAADAFRHAPCFACGGREDGHTYILIDGEWYAQCPDW